ncbi:uncharacterized protein RIOK2 [Lepeophtheirus salmonis]|uniref:uncharacterized protein RIOK2 n=1 Tax=Lepeophtheirus salmonis TaxID=72036 RepID=UPI001AE65E40|nr:serine/threonine-protein kinase rio2-like [Lepeophtheirus salmonis]
MGKLNVTLLRYLGKDEFRILTGVEMGMKNHELVPGALVAAIASVKSGGVHRILRELSKHRLVQYERGKRYDGYRLTNLGYDYLSLKALAARESVSGFGNQIGCGKESNVYIVNDNEGRDLALKLHRLGRICFRKVKEKRDYHKNRRNMSWIYLSRISATKEFAYMKALYDRGFPVPEPIDFNRHCVVMSYVHGTPLQNIREVDDPGALYESLMNLHIKFANHGVIHGDFNEFNIMITDEGKPIVIDFPQMISVMHPEAETFFKRDVVCLREFFKRRFDFESDTFPDFNKDVTRTDVLDAEIRASGMTKQMEKDILIELGIDDEEEDQEYEDDEEGTDGESDKEQEETQIIQRVVNVKELASDPVLSEISQNELKTDFSHLKIQSPSVSSSTSMVPDEAFPEIPPPPPLEEEENDEVSSLINFSYHDDTHSVRSFASSTGSTIAPDVIKKRVKASLERRRKQEQTKRIRAKGEASAVTRSRRENTFNIKTSTSAFWADD